jgi:hypothetical protein
MQQRIEASKFLAEIQKVCHSQFAKEWQTLDDSFSF